MNEFEQNSIVPEESDSGFTLIELLIVVVIIIVFSTLAIPSLQELVPRYRLNGTAKEMASVVQQARLYSVAQGIQYKLCLSDADLSASDDSPSTNTGRYTLSAGNSAYNSSTWDILPIDDSGVDSNTGEGDTVLTYAADNTEYRGVSLVGWTALGGSGVGNQDCLMFTPRGWLDNPSGDFDGGFIYIQFRNKYANPEVEIRTLRISRGGSVTILNGPFGAMSTGSGPSDDDDEVVL